MQVVEKGQTTVPCGDDEAADWPSAESASGEDFMKAVTLAEALLTASETRLAAASVDMGWSSELLAMLLALLTVPPMSFTKA